MFGFRWISLDDGWNRLGRPLTVRQVSERIDVENLTRWFLSVLFCATEDAFQIPGPFYDSSKTDRELVLDQLGYGSKLSAVELELS